MDKIAHIPGFVAHHYLHVFDVEEIILKRSIMCSWCTAWLSVPTRSLKDSSTSDWRLARHGSYLPRARCRTSLEIIIVGAEGSCIVRWNFFWKGEEKGEEKGERRKREKVSLSLSLFFSVSKPVCLSFRPDEAFARSFHAPPPNFRATKNFGQVCQSRLLERFLNPRRDQRAPRSRNSSLVFANVYP